MLKFQDNNTTIIATFEDFILTTYVIIDELYHQFAPPEVTSRRHIFPYSQFQSVLITSSIAFPLQSVNLGVHDIVKHFVVMVLIMENVLPKKKLITDIKYML